MSESKQYCTFTLGDYFFGVDVRHVQEVLRYQDLTPVPLAASVVRGLINLRGQIVTAISLRECLQMPELKSERSPMNIVLRTDEGPMSCLVDEIGDVLEVDEELYEEAPETIDGIAKTLILGAYKLEGRLLLVLDIEKTVGVTVLDGVS